VRFERIRGFVGRPEPAVAADFPENLALI